jgi:hypothetical protein
VMKKLILDVYDVNYVYTLSSTLKFLVPPMKMSHDICTVLLNNYKHHRTPHNASNKLSHLMHEGNTCPLFAWV